MHKDDITRSVSIDERGARVWWCQIGDARKKLPGSPANVTCCTATALTPRHASVGNQLAFLALKCIISPCDPVMRPQDYT